MKPHWKKPFRDSVYNIRTHDWSYSMEDNAEHTLPERVDISHIPHLANAARQPNFDDIKFDGDKWEGTKLDDPDRL